MDHIIDGGLRHLQVFCRDALAQGAGMHKSSLYKISKGEVQPSMKILGRLCKVLVCQPGDLLRFVDADEALARAIAQGMDDKED